MEMGLETGNRLGRAIFGICALIGLVAAALLSIGLERARAAEDGVSVSTATNANAIAEDPGIGSPVLELNGEYTYTLAFPYVTKPDYLMFHNFDYDDWGWTDFLNYHRLNPDQWYWGSNFGYEGGGGLRHDAYRGGGIREAHDALTMYLAPDAHGSDPQDWTDYRYTSKVKVIEGNQAGVWFRGTYTQSANDGQHFLGYYCVVSARHIHDGDRIHLLQMRTYEEPGSPPPAKDKNYYHFANPKELVSGDLDLDLRHDRWYEMVVEVRGPNIKCYIQDAASASTPESVQANSIEYTDTVGSVFTAGTIGLKVYKTGAVTFDDVIVEPLD